VDFEVFFLIGKPHKVSSHSTLKLTELTYLPKVDNPRRDWVASVAVPAFMAYSAQKKVRSFATIGTGAGLDAIAAVEIFDLERLVITDLHQAVVDAAAKNVRTATAGFSKVRLFDAARDILVPLVNEGGVYDQIYENLPNIPLSIGHCIDAGQTSSTYVPGRFEDIPSVATENLLALHFLALTQAKQLLSPSGAVISSIGGRVSVAVLLKMAFEAGYKGEILTYIWKIRSEPEEVIGGYKKNQEDGHGPFYFYPTTVLEEVFHSLHPAVTGSQAADIEKSLFNHRVDASAAYDLHKDGVVMGHTVAIVRSTPL
ncbi:hypothetical protein C8R44DRAFT_638240, partial [Mycena epipterygia]